MEKMLSLLLLPILLNSVLSKPYDSSNICPTCEPEYCPKSGEECPRGLVPDTCGCCHLGLCQLKEGDRCLHPAQVSSISETDLGKYGSCGDRMACSIRTDIDERQGDVEATCSCLDLSLVCGTDNITYDNVCILSDAPGSPRVRNLGPCESAPLIVAGPVDIQDHEGNSLALDCEIRGFPVPYVRWEFTNTAGVTKVLPGDDVDVVVQTRGGPEEAMITSWMQIVSTRPINSGTYMCVATNNHGEATAVANIRIHPRY